MSRVAIDASVVVKWLFPGREDEAHDVEARGMLEAVGRGDLEIVQPPHWLAEACAVAVRLDPPTARRGSELLEALEFPISDHWGLYPKAIELAATLNHHLFDTLYHAVAMLEPETVLVTADEKYYRKAAKIGKIIRLEEYGRALSQNP